MLVTTSSNHRNQRFAVLVASTIAVLAIAGGLVNPLLWCLLLLSPVAYWLIRRRTLHRLRVIEAPFPDEWDQRLFSHVEFFRALNDDQKDRFRNLVKVFLDEIPITGVRTDVDELTRVLVAASAVIPIFGFDDWEYRRLGEVLIYPSAFDGGYQTDEGADRNTLGMIGVNHLSGVMILSKPDLIAGFTNAGDKRNVGIHEFAHLVDKADGSVDGLPIGIPSDVVSPWIQWVGNELGKPDQRGHIDGYAYTNEAEYFAVLSEYFFETPDLLAQKDPQTYQMLQAMYRQDTRSLLRGVIDRPKRVGRNSPCPCGSGKKFKRCCRSRRVKGRPKRARREKT